MEKCHIFLTQIRFYYKTQHNSGSNCIKIPRRFSMKIMLWKGKFLLSLNPKWNKSSGNCLKVLLSFSLKFVLWQRKFCNFIFSASQTASVNENISIQEKPFTVHVEEKIVCCESFSKQFHFIRMLNTPFNSENIPGIGNFHTSLLKPETLY